MQKQENFNLESIKHNKITLFLTRFIFRDNMNFLRKSGFIDSYVKNEQLDEELIRDSKDVKLLYLVFKNGKMSISDISKIIEEISIVKVKILYTQELINNYSLILVEFPKEFDLDYNNLIAGKYSKLSEEFKNTFPEIEDAFNDKNQKIGKRHTIYYHIFNKTEWLKNLQLKRLGLVELDDKLELWGKPSKIDTDLDFNSLK